MQRTGAIEANQLPAGGIGRSGQDPMVKETSVSTTDFNNFKADIIKPTPPPGDVNKGAGGMKKCLRRFSAIMLSHLGTLLIVILYVVMGGFLFSYLETSNEISGCLTSEGKYLAKLSQVSDLVYSQAQGSNATDAQINILTTLMEFATDVYSLDVDPKFNCSSYNEDHLPNWNIINAAYFCVTIVTTIGYGHISPMTQWGQIVCIVYGILGIPLMLLFLSKIGEPTAIMFRTFYLNICCCKCFIKKLSNENKSDDEEGATGQTNWASAAEEGQGGKTPPAKVIEVIEEEEEEEDEDDEIVNIPITVTIMLLTVYVVMGAAVFKIWEKWTITEGAYFSFITLSTIGFGDYVPGRNGPFDSSTVIVELIVGCVYCIFGLALLSMCINLIQDEMAAKFRWIGSKLGVSSHSREGEDDEDESDDDEDSSSGDEEETDSDDVGTESGHSRRNRNGVASKKPPPTKTQESRA